MLNGYFLFHSRSRETTNKKKNKIDQPTFVAKNSISLNFKKKLYAIRESYNVGELDVLLDTVISGKLVIASNEDRLSYINMVLSIYKANDIKNAIINLINKKNFFVILSKFYVHNPDESGANYWHHLTHLQNFLLNYIKYFPFDKLSHDEMKKIFSDNYGYGSMLVMSQTSEKHPHFEIFIRTALNKQNIKFFNIVLQATKEIQRIKLLKEAVSKNAESFKKMGTMCENASENELKNLVKLCDQWFDANTTKDKRIEHILKLIDVPDEKNHTQKSFKQNM